MIGLLGHFVSAAACMPEAAGLLAGVAYGPVLVGALLAGAGRPESEVSGRL